MFLRLAIEAQNFRILKRATAELFQEDELPAYRYILQHYDTYQELPSIEIMQQQGHALPRTRSQSSNPQYYLDRMRKRFAYSRVNERHPRLVEAMKSQDVDGMLETLREMIQITAGVVQAAPITEVREDIAPVTGEYEDARHTPGLRGITTGWPTLDEMTNGLAPGELMVIAGRPSMGKSFLLNEMAYSAWSAGHPIAIMSMEMTKEQIIRRWIGRMTGINPRLIRSGELGTYQDAKFRQAVASLQNTEVPIFLMAGNMRKTVDAIESAILECNPDVMYVDAAYLLSPSSKGRGYVPRWEAISDVVRELREMALRHNARIVITVQFNRNQKSNSRREADLGDIGGSDTIPQDASIVLGARKGPAPHQKTQRILDVMKNRDGDTGRFATAFQFGPVGMWEVPLVEEVNEGEETVASNTNWML